MNQQPYGRQAGESRIQPLGMLGLGLGPGFRRATS